MSTPVKASLNISSDLKNELLEKIPILRYKDLLNLVLNFSKALSENNIEEINIAKSAIDSAIRQINGIVKKNMYHNESYVQKNGDKYVKSHELSANGLLEAIVHCVLHYFDNSITVNSRMNLSNDRNKLLQIMNNVEYMSFGNYILELYKRDDINDDEKNRLLLEILQKIAIKLEYLQRQYTFIHGDFHMNNIYVKVNIQENGTLIVDVRFIDFGQSIIMSKGIIFTPFEEFYGNKYGDKYMILRSYLYDYDTLRSFDLRYLIEDISTKITFVKKNLKLKDDMFLPENFKDITIGQLSINNSPSPFKKSRHMNTSQFPSPNSKGRGLFGVNNN